MKLLRVKSNMNIEEWMAKEEKIAVHEVRVEYLCMISYSYNAMSPIPILK